MLTRISTDALVGSQPASDMNDQDGKMTFVVVAVTVVVVVVVDSDIPAAHG